MSDAFGTRSSLIRNPDPHQTLLIEHVVTDDSPDGQCWPPVLGDGWHLINSAGGKTLWRRIILNTQTGGKHG